MKLTDIPPHISEMKPPWFPQALYTKYGISCDYDDAQPKWHISYYDGPISGIFTCKGKMFYGRMVYDQDRKFWVSWDLTPEEEQLITANHEEFQKWVGTHTDYFLNEDEDWVRGYGTLPREGMDNYYKNEDRPKVDWKEIESRDIFGVLFNPFSNSWR